MFKTTFGNDVFKQKYAQNQYETWDDKAKVVVNWVCGDMDGTKNSLMSDEEKHQLIQYITDFKFMPGGRYLWYAGREARYFNNCYMLRLEDDTREEWAGLSQRAMSCLMTGGGIGADVSICRPGGRALRRTGGVSSGPLPLLYTLNEIGRNVMQGGSRRSALYGSMDAGHGDVWEFMRAKNWYNYDISGTDFTIADAKKANFNYPAPLDMMNISVNYSDNWLSGGDDEVFMANCQQALMTGEPGFSFNFGDKKNETLRNACTELVSEDDSDVCNLGSVNLANIDTIEEFKDVVALASKFLVCGLIRAHLPYEKVEKVRQQNSRIGLGLMGMHEWLLKRKYRYEMNDELKKWMKVYEQESKRAADEHCDRLFLNRPKGYRAIAPTGTISILAGTTSGVEPIYAVAYRRRYLTDGTRWKYQFVVDGTAQHLIDQGINPNEIESAVDLSKDVERRVKFQYELQKYVDHAISSTVNLPEWGSEFNNGDHVVPFSKIIRKYGHGLRGLTFYPDGSRGGQPIQSVPYEEAHSKRGVIYEDNSEEQCLSGVCNI
jgi:ribonucleoside-diphosphate reductase alpha chain